MKHNALLTSALALSLGLAPALLHAHCGSCGVGEKKESSEAPEHSHKTAGPHGGKILETESGHAEFLIQADRKVAVTFLDKQLKPEPPASQEVSLTAQVPSGKSVLEFEKTAGGFVSKSALPEGDGYMLVLQVKAQAGAKPKNFRIQLNLTVCGGCKKAEYACICEGHS